MTDNLQHILAASVLVTHCERLMNSKRLAYHDELELRGVVAKTRAAFSFGLPGERLNDNTSEQALDAQLDQVGVEIGGTQHV